MKAAQADWEPSWDQKKGTFWTNQNCQESSMFPKCLFVLWFSPSGVCMSAFFKHHVLLLKQTKSLKDVTSSMRQQTPVRSFLAVIHKKMCTREGQVGVCIWNSFIAECLRKMSSISTLSFSCRQISCLLVRSQRHVIPTDVKMEAHVLKQELDIHASVDQWLLGRGAIQVSQGQHRKKVDQNMSPAMKLTKGKTPVSLSLDKCECFSACDQDVEPFNWTAPTGWTGSDPFYYNNFDDVYNCMTLNGAKIVEGGKV